MLTLDQLTFQVTGRDIIHGFWDAGDQHRMYIQSMYSVLVLLASLKAWPFCFSAHPLLLFVY